MRYFGKANEITLDDWIMRCEMWNKSVTEEEYLAQSVEMNKLLFKTLDRNGDGYVSFRGNICLFYHQMEVFISLVRKSFFLKKFLRNLDQPLHKSKQKVFLQTLKG